MKRGRKKDIPLRREIIMSLMNGGLQEAKIQKHTGIKWTTLHEILEKELCCGVVEEGVLKLDEPFKGVLIKEVKDKCNYWHLPLLTKYAEQLDYEKILKSIRNATQYFDDIKMYRQLMKSKFGDEIIEYLFKILSRIASQEIVWDLVVTKLDWILNNFPELVELYPDRNKVEKIVNEHRTSGIPAKVLLNAVRFSPNILSFVLDILEGRVDRQTLQQYYHRLGELVTTEYQYHLIASLFDVIGTDVPSVDWGFTTQDVKWMFSIAYTPEEVLKDWERGLNQLEGELAENLDHDISQGLDEIQRKPEESTIILKNPEKSTIIIHLDMKFEDFKFLLNIAERFLNNPQCQDTIQLAKSKFLKIEVFNIGTLAIPPKVNLHHFINYTTIYRAILGLASMDKHIPSWWLAKVGNYWKNFTKPLDFPFFLGH